MEMAASNVGYPGKKKKLLTAGNMAISDPAGSPSVNPSGIMALVVAPWLNMSMPMMNTAMVNTHG